MDFIYRSASRASLAFRVSSMTPNCYKSFYFNNGYVVGKVLDLCNRLCHNKALPRNNAAVIEAHLLLSASPKLSSYVPKYNSKLYNQDSILFSSPLNVSGSNAFNLKAAILYYDPVYYNTRGCTIYQYMHVQCNFKISQAPTILDYTMLYIYLKFTYDPIGI